MSAQVTSGVDDPRNRRAPRQWHLDAADTFIRRRGAAVFGNFMQSVQHVNARLPYGWLLERVIVSPIFHRRHHAVGYGHEGTRYAL